MAFPEAHRLSLARDLHDTVLQEFLVIVMQLRRLEQSAGSEAGRRVAFGLQAATRGIDCARRLLVDLRSSPPTAPSVPAVTLATELADTLDAVIAPTSLRSSLRCPDALALPPRVQRELVRIVREAATNAVRHADARRIDCRVDVDHDHLTVAVDDDGRGLPTTGFSEGHGLTGMRERAALVGATLRMTGNPEGGTTIVLKRPIDDRPPSARPPSRPESRRSPLERAEHG